MFAEEMNPPPLRPLKQLQNVIRFSRDGIPKDAEMNEFLSNVPAFRSGKAVEIIFALFKNHFGVNFVCPSMVKFLCYI